jgi:hypothetical protein
MKNVKIQQASNGEFTKLETWRVLTDIRTQNLVLKKQTRPNRWFTFVSVKEYEEIRTTAMCKIRRAVTNAMTKSHSRNLV